MYSTFFPDKNLWNGCRYKGFNLQYEQVGICVISLYFMTKICVLLLPYNFYRWLDKASLIFDKTLKLAVSVKLTMLRKIGGGGGGAGPTPPHTGGGGGGGGGGVARLTLHHTCGS